MKTKLFSLILVFTLTGSMAFSQEPVDSKTSVAILGGVNLQNLNGKDMNGDKLENDLLTGFHVGLNAQIPLAPEFYFQPGLMFSTKGAKMTEGDFSGTYKLSYIELPLNFVYKAVLGNGYFLLGFGPYVAYGVGGKATYESGSVSVETDIEFKNEVESGDPLTTAYIKPFDAGANLFFGYELQTGLFLQLNTQLGLLDIHPDDARISGDDKSTLKNTGFGLSLGYRF
ncbi:porin family protein [Marinilabilia sp.]|uniref:porin family protein n=1 Tax=Marinilabilia sp. TaxID=2021252 RepID=UPI0025BD980C|nr:porin family protein [Marinilabilia sp.]